MANPLVHFQSENYKKESRKMLKEARKSYLEKVKEDYEKDKQRKEKIKARGDDKWMLPSVDQRVEKEQQTLKSKKKKKEKKKKKHKEKKEKKHKHRDVSDSSSSDTNCESEGQWVEKDTKTENVQKSESLQSQPLITKGPNLERDSWMMSPVEMFPTVTRQELRDRKKKDEKDNNKATLFEKPGDHELELNPYWKAGGTGLPDQDAKKTKSESSVGDGGLSWLKRAYDRCVQKAKDEGITLEQAAAETWGSLKKLEKMLKSAEKVAVKKVSDRHQRPNDRNKEDSWRQQQPSNKQQFHKPCYDSEEGGDMSFVRNSSRSQSRDSDSGNSEGKESRKHNYHESSSKERDHYHRYQQKIRSRHSRSRSKERDFSCKKYEKRRSRSRSQERIHYSRRDERSNDSRQRFMRPGQMDSGHSRPSHQTDRERNYSPAWKKREFIKPLNKEDDKSESDSNVERETEQGLKKKGKRESTPNLLSADSGSSSDSSSDSSDSSDDTKEDEPIKTVTILTEDQMNQLSAKILKAEIMGDEELMSRLKVELEQARKLREEHKDDVRAPPMLEQSGHEDEDVILTITDQRGMVRPVLDRQHPVEPKGGRRRKKQKVTTHDNQGNRERYFDDDDRFDLKKLVEREKMGTAEDQNRMFARLAGRIAEKTDEDYQMDDVLITKSAQRQSDSQKEERERSMAIFEHKKVTAAIEKCQFCFDNVAKHLIIAIGLQTYLCLPNCCSLTEGHCLIVPMTHVSSGTAMDEDVWSEIQIFRKALTKMFADRELDVIFMEMSTNLKRFPHTFMECVPIPKEVGDLAPIYFKKAILECDTEWSQNKKLVELGQKNVRRSVPKGLPYFSVDFGLQGGFAHVIEAEHLFPNYFGKEIIGGMLDVEHRLWRKPPRQSFDDQRKKVLAFAEWWKLYDWTMKINKDD